MTWTHTRQMVYLCWVFIFAIAFLDDAFRIHEQVGETFNRAFLEGFMGDNGEFVGQLLVAGIYALLFGGALLIVLFFFGIVVFFAVFVDALHGFLLALRPELKESVVFQGLFNVFEEGGELVSLSLALAAVIAVRAAAMAPGVLSPAFTHHRQLAGQ
jgi:hypothetical protein